MSDSESLEQASAALAGISVLAANTRVILASDRYTIIGATRASVVALFSGLVCSLFLHDLQIDYYWKLAIVCIAGVLAEDLIRALLTVGKKITEKPLEIALKIIFRE